MIHGASLFCVLLSTGVFGDTVKSVSVMEGDSVTLNTDATKVQRDDQMLWMFGPKETRLAEIHRQTIYIDVSDTIFDKILQMDNQTGSLIIRNIRTEHSGLYKLQIISNRATSYKRFNVSVYAPLPVPVIISNSSKFSSSSSGSSGQNCSVLCSVLNVGHVTLSWYKGHSLLSSISVSDLSVSLSLPLVIECLDDSYSCVVAYSFTNQTKHINNITDLCQPCPEQDERSRLYISIAVIALLLLLAVASSLMCCHRKSKQTEKEVKVQEEEILYADTTFCAYQVKNTDFIAKDQTEYSTVINFKT